MPGSKRGEDSSSGTRKALIGAAVAAGAGAALFFSRRNGDGDGERVSDAPEHSFRDTDADALIGRTVTIGKPRQELYDAWRDFTRFPSFMDNVDKVEKLDARRSRWTIKAPAGGTVELVTALSEDKPGMAIAWKSEPESDVETEGRVEFTDAPAGRGTYVRLTMRYDPPLGVVGRAVAKVMQREPDIQARRDLRRFKQLMETGEVTTNASPSARGNESPTEARI